MANGNNRGLVRQEPPELPVSPKDWEEALVIKDDRTLNDHVQDIHKMLVRASDPQHGEYVGLLRAVYDTQAIEGSLSADNTLAAMLIRERAKKMNEGHALAEEKLATIVRALGVVLRRYNQDRKSRRNMVDGQRVPDGADAET